ncbi:hypothetical protein FX983_02696 [Pseudomonas frederiksbergensis]|uniref:Uncharacterized protein n=1 Tax=Pseudomonas frederiksbergensis TaxID=104087 RepID=A0A6L5C5C3_9PSED|nr:hypothetical protein FX983_02696 [Pseudomonas frederiksbergensis]
MMLNASFHFTCPIFPGHVQRALLVHPPSPFPSVNPAVRGFAPLR